VSDVVRSIRTTLECDVLVVDDGSTDRTAEVARSAGALVLSHPFNLGVGAAVRSGMRFAAMRGYAVAVQVDADGQHDAAEAARLVERLEADGADLVIGSRFAAGYKTGLARRISMRALSRVVSRRLGTHISDTTSGFRAFGKRAIEQYARGYPTAYLSDTVEALLLADDWDFVVVEEPVQMHQRLGGQPSSGRAKSAFHFLRLWLIIALHRGRRPLPLRRAVSNVET
jgi:glycosyltransferase involved in cell wall biosynthesis